MPTTLKLLSLLWFISLCNAQRYAPATVIAYCDNDLEVYRGSTLVADDKGRTYREPSVFTTTPRNPNWKLTFHCTDLGGGGGFAAVIRYLGVNYTTTYPMSASYFDLISSSDNITNTTIYEQRPTANYTLSANNNPFNLTPYWWWNDNILNTMVFEFDFSKLLRYTKFITQCNNVITSICVSLPGDGGSCENYYGCTDCDGTNWPEQVIQTNIMVGPQSYVEVQCTDTRGLYASFIGTYEYPQGSRNFYPTKNPVNSPTSNWRLMTGTAGWFASYSQYNAKYGGKSGFVINPDLSGAQALWSGVGTMWETDLFVMHRFRMYFDEVYDYSAMMPYSLNPTPSPTEPYVCTPNSTHPACNRYETPLRVGTCEEAHNLYDDSAERHSTGLRAFAWLCIAFGSFLLFLMMCELLLYVIWRTQDEEWQTQHNWYDDDGKKRFKMIVGRMMNSLFHFVVLFWCALATFYGINQLYRLSYSNFWCDGEKTLEEIHEFNYENQCKTGDRDSCYSTDAIIDFYKVRNNNPSDLYKSESDINPANLTYAILFFLLSFIFLLLSLMHVFKLLKCCKKEIETGCCHCWICYKMKQKSIENAAADKEDDEKKEKEIQIKSDDDDEENKEDIIKADDQETKEEEETDPKGGFCGCCTNKKGESDDEKGQFMADNDNKEDVDTDTEDNCAKKCIGCVKDQCLMKIVRFYKTHLELDSTWSVHFMIFMKFFNIHAQIVYLCALGGTSLGYVLTGGDKQVILAERPEFIALLSIVIFCDTLFVCGLWFLYGCLPHIFYGVQFKFMNHFIDLAFKVIYSLFPVIVHGTIYHWGLFQFKTFGRFYGPFVAMLFVVWKVHKILAQSRELAERGDIINHQHDDVMGEDAFNTRRDDDPGADGYDGEPCDGEEIELSGKQVTGTQPFRRHWNVDNYMATSVYRWDKLTNDKYGKEYLMKLKEKEEKENRRKIWIQKHKRKMAKAKREGLDCTQLEKELEEKMAESYEIEEEESENGVGATKEALAMRSGEEYVFKYSYLRGPYMEKYDARDDAIKHWNLFIFHGETEDIENQLRNMIDEEKKETQKGIDNETKKAMQVELELTSVNEEDTNKKANRKSSAATAPTTPVDTKKKPKRKASAATTPTPVDEDSGAKMKPKRKTSTATKPDDDIKKKKRKVSSATASDDTKKKKRKSSTATASAVSVDDTKKKKKRKTSAATAPTTPVDTKKKPKRKASAATTPTAPLTSVDEDSGAKKKPKRKTSSATKSDDDIKKKKRKTSAATAPTTPLTSVDENTTKSDDDIKKKKRKTSTATKSNGETEEKTAANLTAAGEKTVHKKYKNIPNASPSPSPLPNGDVDAFDIGEKKENEDEYAEYDRIIRRIMLCNHLKRGWLYCAALVYLTVGILVITFVHLDLNESDRFCTQIAPSNLKNLSTSEWELISEYPELALYNEACTLQVFELFGAYPCNCRLFNLYLENGVNSICVMKDHFNANQSRWNANDYIDATLRKWTMIERYLIGSQYEELSCLRYDESSVIHLEDVALYDAQYMQVIALSGLQISAISPAISQYIALQALFIQYVDGFDDNTTMPWDEIGDLPLKVLALRGIDADLIAFPVGLCDLRDSLVYFNFEWSKMTNIDACMGEFDELRYATFPHNRITNIPWDMLQLDAIKRIAFPGNSIQGNVFTIPDSNIDFNLQISPSIVELDFLWNNFCENVTFYTNNSLIIEGCKGVCTKDYNSLYCNNNMIGDGVCNPECNSKTCLYDGGDCIQLCDFTKCAVSSIADGICNEECNSIDCRWDGGDCDEIECTINPYLNTYIVRPLWSHVDDGICDLHLLESNCSLYEYESDCKVCSATCDALYLPFIKLSQGDEIIDVNDWCNEELWVLVQQQLNKANQMITDCHFFLQNYRFDLNGNNVTGFHEFLYLFGYNMQAKPQGIEQTDCRACMNNPDLYYV